MQNKIYEIAIINKFANAIENASPVRAKLSGHRTPIKNKINCEINPMIKKAIPYVTAEK